jgi:glycosyltransferase involved in cell wall biosynthesis
VVKRLAFAIPGDLATATGGYAYDRRMIAELGKLGWTIDIIGLGENFPWASRETLMAAEARLLMVPASRQILVDGLALGVLPEAARRLREQHTLVVLVHHPLALETGLSAAQAKILQASVRAALMAAKHVIVTSDATAQQLADSYGVPRDKITVACPGTDPVMPAPGSQDGIVRILSVGAVVPRKGFDILLAALATLSDLPWRLTIAGDRNRDAATAARLEADIARFKLGRHVSVLGAVSAQQLADLYASSDMFALASRFEGYGMAYSEAIAYGLPVIGTRAGAIPEVVPSGAGILVAPDDIAAFAHALRTVVADAEVRRQLASVARATAAGLPRWQDSAKIFSSALETVA